MAHARVLMEDHNVKLSAAAVAVGASLSLYACSCDLCARAWAVIEDAGG